MHLHIPDLSLIVLIGASGSGKSTFARTHFLPTEVVSSDFCRALISNNENSMDASDDAFELLHFLIAKRLKRGLLTVVDATNVEAYSRKKLIQLAKDFHVLPVAVVFNLPEEISMERNKLRSDRNFGNHVIAKHVQSLRKSLRTLKSEGFRQIEVFRSEEEVQSIQGFVREPLYNDRRTEQGPFDIIGDIHGCYDELTDLLRDLGYEIHQVEENGSNYGIEVMPPPGRRALFLGDLVDRGPKSPQVLRLVMSMVKAGTAFCVPGNHDIKLEKKLSGKEVQLKYGLAETMQQLEQEPESFRREVKDFIYRMVSHYVLDNGKLVTAHAGLREEMHGRASGAVRSFCLYGETTGEIDEFGLPVRQNWAAEYRGRALVVYGHTPVPAPDFLNHTINIDTGCVFGGHLTALRYPEKEIVQVAAKRMYYEPVRPFQPIEKASYLSAQQLHDDLPDIEDVIGKRYVETRLRGKVTVQEENAITALEVMSRFAVHPRWLIYLPPTMSPSETSTLPDLLEHPKEAFAYFRKQGLKQVICEEKHMGSRAVVVICRNAEAAQARFGATMGELGSCYTRTGRAFFTDKALERQFLERLSTALGRSGFWERFNTDWACLDTELMPWSAKAMALVKEQYAAVGAAARTALHQALPALEAAAARGIATENLLNKLSSKQHLVKEYTAAYGRYCWPVYGIEDYRLAAFHLLATEGALHTDKNHLWHMEQIYQMCEADPDFLVRTPYQVVNLEDEEQVQSVINWWVSRTEAGGEGMVIKPLDFISKGPKGLIQPALKCRGREYLRIIYGPEYTLPENLERLKARGLSTKRSLALREFALGVEALERFVKKEPLRKVHECVFAVLAMESEAVDPRL